MTDFLVTNDIPALLAEIERLKAENERLAVHGGRYMKLCEMRADMTERAYQKAEKAELELTKVKAERDAALLEVCRRCPDGEVIDGIKHYPCNGCKWRGVQEKYAKEVIRRRREQIIGKGDNDV